MTCPRLSRSDSSVAYLAGATRHLASLNWLDLRMRDQHGWQTFREASDAGLPWPLRSLERRSCFFWTNPPQDGIHKPETAFGLRFVGSRRKERPCFLLLTISKKRRHTQTASA